MIDERISEKLPYPSKYVEVYGSRMHYIEAGSGNPILFLHGIPTSCYLWRNIIPHLSSLGRCIAPDLIGFGKSDKPDIKYTVVDHIKYVEKFIETLGLKHITLIMHGWGSVIGLDYAMRHEENCVGLVFYEAFLRSSNGDDISLPFQEQLISLQNQPVDDFIVDGSAFVDRIIPQMVMRQLTEKEMNHYREPFVQEGSGKPIAQYLKELPRGNEKNEVEQLIASYSKKLTKSQLPKLMLYSVPGFVTTIATAMWAKEHLPNLEIVDIGEELHLAQESYPQLIGESISVWLQGVEQMRRG
ncbi:haloalkane dehalogenase [Aquicella lusitana]|uniref:Haloalkane dehalogenase n=1 Tax=Aquicella lusitana TaxID=254246 RepID=A0A370GRP1_9COXI|nr:haloalkane dehalogenase [Aquicella lusitana]RDI46069.1 haloalkane dehalogenase [Aquicella lusitana]VVC73334.1 Haloalkane dehalogenase [Aquicella lusitana]